MFYNKKNKRKGKTIREGTYRSPSQVIPDSAHTYFPTKPRRAGIYRPR
jgi:hypothetical protein